MLPEGKAAYRNLSVEIRSDSIIFQMGGQEMEIKAYDDPDQIVHSAFNFYKEIHKANRKEYGDDEHLGSYEERTAGNQQGRF